MNAERPPRENEGRHQAKTAKIESEAQPGAMLAPGQLIAQRFVIERLAGTGGMGTVYRANDLASGGPVAVKIVSGHARTKDERFAREARLLAQIDHPAVVRYVAHGLTAQGVRYLAMEWLEGEDLAARLAHTGLKIDETLALMRRVCAGLAVAHEKGMTHRDIKPSNLFLVQGRPEAAKLLDFGVARQTGSARRLTRAGSALGTVGYMAPEQAMGLNDVDARADVFALGCVLFECLTGHVAFQGPHDVAVLAKVLREDVPRVRDARPDIPDSLDALAASLLAKDRAQRPRDAGAVLAALEQLGDLQGAAVPSTRKPSGSGLAISEQRIASVIVARPHGPAPVTLASNEAAVEAEQLETILQRFGARPVPLRAGHLLLVFGAAEGIIASDQAIQAVRCALRLSNLKPQLKIGVATGGLETAFNVSVGVAIDRAAALLEGAQEVAEGVLVDDLTAGLLHGGFELEQRRDSLCVVAELEDAERPRLLLGKPSPCVGRDKELGLLEATLAECSADQVARALLVTAAPGTGKSRLGREFLDRVRAKSTARAFIARADPMSMRSALHLVQRLLQHAIGLREGDPPDLRRARLQEYLSALVEAARLPWLLEFLGELVGVSGLDAASPLLCAARSDPAVMREQTRRAVQHWLAAELDQSPVVILLEDLQWGDLPSINYLEDSVQALSDRAIFMIALARPDVHEQFPDLFKLFGRQELRLQGLTRPAMERLVREMLPVSTERTIVVRILELADGNAFYLEELIRRVAEGSTELPETVRAIVRSRLDGLQPDARRHLRAASVFGETSWVGGVRDLLGGDVDAESWFTLLVREEIFVQRHQARFPNELEYVFRHALLRDAAYAMLSEDDRRTAHALAGEWLETVGERDPCVLADHFERGDLPERARPWLLRAARLALGRGDLEAAVALARRGLLLGALGQERGELLLVQGHASAWGTLTNLDLAKEALDLLPSASGSWWFSLSLLVFGASAIGRAELAEPYLELAKLTPPPSEEGLGAYGQAFEVLAVGAVLVGRPDIGWAMFSKFQRLVESAPDYVSRAWLDLTHCQLATNSTMDGKWQLERAVCAGREAVLGMRAAGAISGEATALFHLGIALRELGCYQEAEHTLRASLQKSIEVGNVLIAEFSRLVLAVFALRDGGLKQGVRELTKLAQSSDANIVHACQSIRAQLYLRHGRTRQAIRLASEATRGPGLLRRTTAAMTLARAQLISGEPELGLEVLERACEARGSGFFPQLTLDMHAIRADLLSALGDARGATDSARAALCFVMETAAAIEDAELRAAFSSRRHLSARLRSLLGQP